MTDLTPGSQAQPTQRPARPRRGGRWAFELLFAAALAGCFGGQTGQPMSDSGDCPLPRREVPWDRATRGVVPLDAVAAVEGSYTEPLVWVDASGVSLPGEPEDVLTLTFTAEGSVAMVDPCGSDGPFVDMRLDAVTRDLGPIGSGVARVTFEPAPLGAGGEIGRFESAGDGFSVSGRFLETESGTTVSGRLGTWALGEPREGRFPPVLAR